MQCILNTPVLFLIFNRPDTTQKVFDQIKLVKPKYLFVAADGPRNNVKDEVLRTSETRAIIEQIDWDCQLKLLFRNENLGCKYSVSSAITWFFSNVTAGIILEDDCFPDISFFFFCEELLEKYKFDERVSLIGGNCFQISTQKDNKYSYYFSKYPHIWGWASWKRVWDLYDVEMKDYNETLSRTEFSNIFYSTSEESYWRKVFARTKSGLVNTWDYQLTYSIWKNQGICISPIRNLVINLGFINNSTHFFLNDSLKSNLKLEPIPLPLVHPNSILLDKKADIFTFDNIFSHSYSRLLRLFKENSFMNLLGYLLSKLNYKL